MGLTNVYMWDSQVGYRKVRLEEAIEKYEYGVSAKSGIFFCGWCGEDISLSNPGKNQRHFKHTRKDVEINCKDKIQAQIQAQATSLVKYNDNKLILKLEIINKQPKFYIGFPRVVDLNNKEGNVVIHGVSNRIYSGNEVSNYIATYSVSERFCDNVTTYLSIQEKPYEKYILGYSGALFFESKKGAWPTELQGVSPEGTFFDAEKGYRINNGIVYMDHEYYLVAYGKVDIPSELYPKEIDNNFKLYHVKAKKNWKIYSLRLPIFTRTVSLSVRKFLAKYQLLLRAKSMKIFPIWPVCAQYNDIVYHNSQNLYFYLLGNDAKVKKYPEKNIGEDITLLPIVNQGEIRNENIASVKSLGCEQLVTIGLDGISQYLYLKQSENFYNSVECPLNIYDEVTSWKPGEYTVLPKDNKLSVESSVDGTIEMWHDGTVCCQEKIKANEKCVISNINWGCTLKIYQGIDCNAKFVFVRPKPLQRKLGLTDKALCLKLQKCKSSNKYLQNLNSEVKVLLQNYPYTKKWVYEQIKFQTLPIKAYRLLVFIARDLYKEI